MCDARTFAPLLRHDGVTERQQSEELLHTRLTHLYGFHQAAVMETELWVAQWVKGEINTWSLLK